MEKCGGITLHHLIQHNIPGYVALRSWEYWSNKPGAFFTSTDLRRLRRILPFVRGIGGHTTRTYAGYEDVVGDDIRYITFLRDPVSRYLSHFNYQRQVMGIDWTLDAFLADGRFDNYQTIRLAPDGNVQSAKRQIDLMSFVGIVEEFNTSLLLLRSIVPELFSTVCYERKNVGSTRRGGMGLDELSVEQRGRIVEKNADDMELYRHATKRFDREKQSYRGDLDGDLATLTTQLESYTYPRLRATALFALRNAVRYTVQPVIRAVGRPRPRPHTSESAP